MQPMFIVGLSIAVFAFAFVFAVWTIMKKGPPPGVRCSKCGQTMPPEQGIGQRTRGDICPACADNIKDPAKPSLRPEIQALYQPAWQAQIRRSESSTLDSKFCGTPFLLTGEEAPRCAGCKTPLQLFVQLNTSTLPDAVRKEMKPGIYQLFFCVNSDGNCESWEPGSGASLVRRMDIPSEAPPLLALPGESSYPVRTITGWAQVEDLPNWEEMSEMGIEISDGEEQILENLALPLTGDKLRGWPAWVQGVEYPNCPTCQRKMRLLFQVDSEDNIPYMFGDAGAGHITQCEDHPDQLAFGWACC